MSIGWRRGQKIAIQALLRSISGKAWEKRVLGIGRVPARCPALVFPNISMKNSEERRMAGQLQPGGKWAKMKVKFLFQPLKHNLTAGNALWTFHIAV